MYEKYLKEIEQWFKVSMEKPNSVYEIKHELDLIIKIKTIQALDVSAELIKESRKILRK